IAIAYNRTNGVTKLYRNGAVVATGNLGSVRPQTTFPLYLGARVTSGGPGSFYQGLMDEVSIYKRELTDSEVQGIYLAGSFGKTCTAPEILVQPQSVRTRPGTNVGFSVIARGTASLAYKWRLNGSNLTAATNSSLTI